MSIGPTTSKKDAEVVVKVVEACLPVSRGAVKRTIADRRSAAPAR